MSATKEYFLKISEEIYNNLDNDEKAYLYRLGMQVKQIPNESELNDENYLKIRKNRIDAYNAEQEYLFKKRNNIN